MALLTDSERSTLLQLARSSIEDSLLGGEVLARVVEAAHLTPALQEARGVFVTLRERFAQDPSGHPRLRGCIGALEPDEPLYRNVIQNASRAAFDDPRFAAVEARELAGLSIEISALTPLEPLDAPEAIVPGRDGVELQKGSFHAVFLPQVATEQGWDTETLLRHLAQKAGLPPDGWRDAKLWVFQAEVFGEAGCGNASLDPGVR